MLTLAARRYGASRLPVPRAQHAHPTAPLHSCPLAARTAPHTRPSHAAQPAGTRARAPIVAVRLLRDYCRGAPPASTTAGLGRAGGAEASPRAAGRCAPRASRAAARRGEARQSMRVDSRAARRAQCWRAWASRQQPLRSVGVRGHQGSSRYAVVACVGAGAAWLA